MIEILVSQAGVLVAVTGLCLSAVGVCVAIYLKRLEKRLWLAATELGVAKEFAHFGTQVEALCEQIGRMQADIDWLREDRIITQAVDVARTDVKPRGKPQRLTLSARHRRRPN